MLTPDDLRTLSKDDMVETYPLAPGLSKELVLLRVDLTETTDEGSRTEFIVTWFGVTLGRWAAISKAGQVFWEYQ